MRMKQYIFRVLLSVVVMFGLSACGTADETGSQAQKDSDYKEDSKYTEDSGYADDCGYVKDTEYVDDNGYINDTGRWNCAWYVYWDTDVLDEFLLLTKTSELSAASMFSCYFSEDGQIYMPQGFSVLREMAEELTFPVTYLSFTNDVQHNDGSAAQKDPEFLRNLWADADRTEETASAMLAMTRSMGADGIEIDFENIKEPELWTDYAQFLELIWDKAHAEELSMRVVLGVNTPVEDMDFPLGPEYSVMCYYLYGTHSGPGPKADIDFLKKIAEKFSKLQHITYALATGGFEWNDDSVVIRSLTQEAAETLAEESACESGRDMSSGALYYTYQDNGKMFTVWYADAKTLATWRSAILEVDSGAEFDLWRVGGNRWQ